MESPELSPAVFPASAADNGAAPADLVDMSTVVAEAVVPLWGGMRVPWRKVSLWMGDPGIGKSYVSLEMVAALSKVGRRSLIMQVEDGLSDTVKPRLDALGADSKLVRAFASGKAPVLNDAGLAKLEQHIIEWKPSLVTVDPVTYFLGSKRDMHRANQVREPLTALAFLAERYDCSIVPIIHMNKGSDKAIYRALGSIDFIAAVRSVCMFGMVDEEPERGRAMFHIKVNNGALEPPIGFEIDNDGFRWIETDLTRSEIEGRKPGPKPAKSKAAREWLHEFLRSAGGPVQSVMVRAAANHEGISRATLDRVSQEYFVVKERIGGSNDWFWSLAAPPEISQIVDASPGWVH